MVGGKFSSWNLTIWYTNVNRDRSCCCSCQDEMILAEDFRIFLSRYFLTGNAVSTGIFVSGDGLAASFH